MGLEVAPVELHLSGGILATAADDYGPALVATTGQDCGRGFPSTSSAAHAALSSAWQEQDRALTAALHSTAALLHETAETYVATDHTNAAGIQNHSPAANPPPGTPAAQPLSTAAGGWIGLGRQEVSFPSPVRCSEILVSHSSFGPWAEKSRATWSNEKQSSRDQATRTTSSRNS